MPLPLLRVAAGLLAIVGLAGVLLVGYGFAVTVARGHPVDRFELFGVVLGPVGATVAVLVLLLAAVLYGLYAIRGESTPTDGRERDSARKG